jgi:hypothetical protein
MLHWANRFPPFQFLCGNGSLNGESMAEAEGRQMTIREPTAALVEVGLTGDRKEECLMILMVIGGYDTRG